MTRKDLPALAPGTRIVHTRYGLCEVVKIAYALTGGFFGLVLRPLLSFGRDRLLADSQQETPPYVEDYLEDSLRHVQPYRRTRRAS